MSYADLYLTQSPLIISPNNDSEPTATIFGIPFDSTHSYKPGCRFGPDAIRDAFNNIEIFEPNFGVDLESINIQDLGNIQHTVSATEMLDMVGKTTTELQKNKNQLIILGGEHLLTLGTYMSFPKETGYVVFDAHYDLRDQYADMKLSHAAYLRRIVEKRGAENIIHVGARAYVKEELEFLNEYNIQTITNKQIRDGQGSNLLKKATENFDFLYTSIDLDVLDPAFAPGVGNPEAVGITSRELYDMITALQGKKILGADIVELNPSFDNGSTASLAARMISTIIAMEHAKQS
jgi:agmatinase